MWLLANFFLLLMLDVVRLSATGLPPVATHRNAALPSSFAVPVAANGSFRVMLGGGEWLPAGATFVRHSGRTWSTHDGSLVLAGAPASSPGADVGGAFNRTTMRWKAGEALFETSVRVYASHAVFRQTFIQHLIGTNSSLRRQEGVASGWPSFRIAELPTSTPSTADTRRQPPVVRRGVVSWQGIMAGMDTKTGPWGGEGRGVIGEGIAGSGPVAIFAESMQATTVISSFQNFMAASQSVQDSPPHPSRAVVLSYGVMGSVSEISAGFTVETIVTACAGGINQAMMEWGSRLLTQYATKPRFAYRDDFVMQQLGYSTDNGAFYCCCTPYSPPGQQCVNPPPLNETYEETLLAVKSYSVAEKLPYRYILLDSWWYIPSL
jgi:hypothetical protein